MCNCGGAGWLQAANGSLVRCACNPAKSKPVPPNPFALSASGASGRRAAPALNTSAAPASNLAPARVDRYDAREAQTKLAEFNEFLRLNPHVYAAFEAAALEMLNGGEGRVAAKKIIELMRGKVASTGDDYDLNNTWAPWLARKAILAHPQLNAVIETRASLADILLDAAKAVPCRRSCINALQKR